MFENLPKPSSPWAWNPTNPWARAKLKQDWNLTNPYFGKLLPQETLFKPASCPVPCCFSPKQRQPTSCVSPNKSLMWGLLFGVTLCYSLALDCQRCLSPQRCNSSTEENIYISSVTLFLGKPSPSGLQHFLRGSLLLRVNTCTGDFPSEMQHLYWGNFPLRAEL